ncbi:MAG TPA: hypothetical protein VNT75_29550 [Symbiobacteriaceae bacterium]|nr:hypothetical protein [Symbiobacteriaceae bacterium]
MEGSQYLQRLLRHAAATPNVTAAAVAGPVPGTFPEVDLYLTALRGLPEPLPGWVELLGETAFAGAHEIISTDGLTIRVHINQPAPPDAQVLFQRGDYEPAQEAQPPLDLAAAAATFWRDLFQAAAAIGREQPFTAHGRLERCREGLVNLYRLALQPARPGAGWEGLETLPNASKALIPLTEFLVLPLDRRAQWRCAHKLAEAFEKLMLPLTERLGLPYPWAMRNLAFQRLDQTRPDKNSADIPVPKLKDLAEEKAPPTRSQGPARFRVKTRREPE